MNFPLHKDQLRKIRKLSDFDLVMLLSEIEEHGWTIAERTLEMMPEEAGTEARQERQPV